MQPFDLIICGLDELDDHSAAGVTHIISILDPSWPEPEAFGVYGEHAKLELRFDDIIEPDAEGFTAPMKHDVERVLAFGRQMAAEGKPIHLLVHCHAGISRSTASAVLLLAQAMPERPEADIVAEIVRIRAKAWPNLRMIEFGDALLNRDGRLIAAVRARHREVALARPEIARFMREAGRQRELDGFEP